MNEDYFPFNSKPPKLGLLDLGAEMPDLTPFRKTAKFFEENGHYPFYDPKLDKRKIDASTGSAFRKFWDEERNRCRHGLTIDGVYITNHHYYYLNYGRIEKVILTPEQERRAAKGETVGKASVVYGFPDPWDADWHMFNYIEEAHRRGKHAAIFKARGVGLSYKFACIGDNTYHHLSNGKVFYYGPSEDSLTATDAILHRTWKQMDFVDYYTPFFKIRQGGKSDTTMVRKAQRVSRKKGDTFRSGSGAAIQGRIIKDANKTRGPRANVVIADEAGINRNIDTIVAISRPALEQGVASRGIFILGGTGGSGIADLAGFSDIIRNPSKYKIFGVPDIFSKVSTGKEMALFIGAYWNNIGAMDSLGRSDKRKAFKQELKARADMAKLYGTFSDKYLQYVSEKCLYPKEALQNVNPTNVPVALLEARIDELGEQYQPPVRGKMNIKDPNLGIFIPDGEAKEITTFPVAKGFHEKGAVVIVEKPKKELTYIAGIDPYAKDKSTTDSLGAIYIMNELTDKIVARYIGKPDKTTDFAKICIAMLRYYNNAIALVENNIPAIISYFRIYKANSLLAPTPTIIKSMITSRSKSNIGMHKVNSIYEKTLNFIIDWLTETSIENPKKKNAQLLDDIGLMKELILSQEKLNFDRLNAVSMLFLYRLERHTQKKVLDEDEDDEEYKALIQKIKNLNPVRNEQNQN